MDLSAGISFFFGQLGRLFFSFGSSFSLSSLTAALVITTLFLVYRRHKRGRRVRWRTITRALFPRRILRSRSNEADIGYLFFNVFVFSLAFGWVVLSYQFVSNSIIAGLVALFGPVTPSALPPYVTRAIITAMLFLAYELGYWFNHWLSHKVPFLWEFHKVHHSAEVLTPLTVFRVHPVYTWIFANILAFSAAGANGLGHYLFGDVAYQYAFADTNIILVLFITPMSICSIRTCGFRSVAWPGGYLSRLLIIRCTTRPIRNTSTRISAAAWRCGTGCSARSTFRARSAKGSPSASPIIRTRIR